MPHIHLNELEGAFSSRRIADSYAPTHPEYSGVAISWRTCHRLRQPRGGKVSTSVKFLDSLAVLWVIFGA